MSKTSPKNCPNDPRRRPFDRCRCLALCEPEGRHWRKCSARTGMGVAR